MKELEAILGEDNLSDNPAVRSSYRWSWGFDIVVTPPGKGPQIVVMPRTVEQVQGIVKLANKEKLTILPVTGCTMTPSFDADILLDMAKMDRIIKIDPENSCVVVEPGVTYNRLVPLVEKEGYTIAHGSFQPSLMVAGYLGVQQGVFHNFGARLGNQSLGIEVVTLDGTLMRTGTAAFCDDYWSHIVWELPDIRGLFKGTYHRAPLMGIITKAAVRIWPVMEAVALPIGGFDSYAKAVKFCQTVSRAGIADQSMVWSWVLSGFHEYRLRGGKDDMDFLTHRMTHDY
jgi:FAD/FMN-containing dehydrogenase